LANVLSIAIDYIGVNSILRSTNCCWTPCSYVWSHLYFRDNLFKRVADGYRIILTPITQLANDWNQL